MSEPPQLSSDEAKIYDRQLRVWGVNSQQRIRSSNVVFLGLSALAGEVCKNLCLAGVNNITVIDWETVTEEGMLHLFLRDVGLNVSIPKALKSSSLQRATASIPHIAELNPMVKVNGIAVANIDEAVEKLTTSTLPFHIIIASGVDYNHLLDISVYARKTNAFFVSTELFGMISYSYFDFLERTVTKYVSSFHLY